jgi:hypothetical protein
MAAAAERMEDEALALARATLPGAIIASQGTYV